jgi:hypothetical protein
MMETVRSKCITQLLLLGAIDSIQVRSFYCVCILILNPSIVSLTCGPKPTFGTIRGSQNSVANKEFISPNI